jgi:hypothetical protein
LRDLSVHVQIQQQLLNGFGAHPSVEFITVLFKILVILFIGEQLPDL